MCSVNIPAGASGPGRISSLVQEVLSELKSIPAKGEESFLLLPKKKKKMCPCRSQAVFGTQNSQLIKETPDGSIAITFCMHTQRPAHLFMHYTRGSFGFH